MTYGLGVVCLGMGGLLALEAAAAAASLPPTAQRDLIDKYCMDCHNYVDYAGGVEFEVFDPANAHEEAKLVERMLRKLRAKFVRAVRRDDP